jgi:hypothetical protein
LVLNFTPRLTWCIDNDDFDSTFSFIIFTFIDHPFLDPFIKHVCDQHLVRVRSFIDFLKETKKWRYRYVLFPNRTCICETKPSKFNRDHQNTGYVNSHWILFYVTICIRSRQPSNNRYARLNWNHNYLRKWYRCLQ